MKFLNKKVSVHFIDSASGESIGETRMDADDLPRSFDTPTQLSISGQDWTVVGAAPKHADEFRRTGRLVLHLSRIGTIAAHDVNFTLPTVSAEFPPVGDRVANDRGAVLTMREDDWRQIEFVAESFADAIADEFAAISDVITDNSLDRGDFVAYSECHVRRSVPRPLAAGIPDDELTSVLADARELLDGVGIRRDLGVQIVEHSFAREIGTIVIYGHVRDANVDLLGVQYLAGARDERSSAAEVIRSIMTAHGLVLIDWCRALRIECDNVSIERYLESMA